MPMASTSTGILPTACVASVWNRMPFSLASLPMAGMSWIVPISLFANMTEIRMVRSVIALRIASTSMSPSGWTGTYDTLNPWRSSRLQTSRPARCSITVVTMWSPFSRYISATPFSARLIDSVPPEVKTSSFGSRAPISVARRCRATSTPASASQPNGWLRLAGWPNFSVKYGIIASTTRGSAGVVDCASMKIGNFSAIFSSPLDRQQLGNVVAGQLGQAHRVEHLTDRRLELVHRASQVAALDLSTVAALETAHDVDRPLQRADHLAHRDLHGAAGQRIAALWTVLALDQPLLGEALEDLRHELGRDGELLGDSLGAHRADGVVNGDIMNRHQPVIGALGESKHVLTVLALPTKSIPDAFDRRLFRSDSPTHPRRCQRKGHPMNEKSEFDSELHRTTVAQLDGVATRLG